MILEQVSGLGGESGSSSVAGGEPASVMTPANVLSTY